MLPRSQRIGIMRSGGIDGESAVQFILYPLNSRDGAVLVEYTILHIIYVILDDDLYAHGQSYVTLLHLFASPLPTV